MKTTVKIITCILVGLIIVHIAIIPGSVWVIFPLALSQGGLDENLSELIHIYLTPGIPVICLYYYWFKRPVNKILIYSWISGFWIVFSLHKNFKYIDCVVQNNFPLTYEKYISTYSFQSAFSVIICYAFLQIYILTIALSVLWIYNIYKKRNKRI